MDKNTLLYICELPPPFGGVTIKNRLIIENIFNDYNLEIFDLYNFKRDKRKILSLGIKLIRYMRKYSCIIYGIGSDSRLDKLLMMQRFLAGKNKLRNTTVFMMGGTFQEYVIKHPRLLKTLSLLNAIYVESIKNINQFNDLGIKNAYYFPNCRKIDPTIAVKNILPGRSLRCVFFSKICKEKGIDIIIEMVQSLTKNKVYYKIDFYGHIDPKIHDQFFEFVNKYDNIHYCGVFDVVNNNVYQKLNSYDVLLFPTKWRSEGVPGILVEAKLAGITSIVSNHNYNSEVVIDKVEGIVLDENSSINMEKVILALQNDYRLINNLKTGSYESRNRYDITKYKPQIINNIFNKGEVHESNRLL